jgi:hypothetical protein
MAADGHGSCRRELAGRGTIRGINKPGTTMVTSAIRGTFVRNQATRNELLNLIYGSGRA